MHKGIMQKKIIQAKDNAVEQEKGFLPLYMSMKSKEEQKILVKQALDAAAGLIDAHQVHEAREVYKQIREVIFNLAIEKQELDEAIDLLRYVLQNPADHEVFGIFVASAMSLASKELRGNLSARLKVYEALLEYDPFDNRLKGLMRKLAREDFSTQKDLIYSLLDKYSDKNRKVMFSEHNITKAMKRAQTYLYSNDEQSARKIYRGIKDSIIFDIVPEKGLERALDIFEEIMQFKNNNDCFGMFVASLMSLASREYRDDLDSRLKIYSLILEYYPGDKQTLGIMGALARDEYAGDQNATRKINNMIKENQVEEGFSDYDESGYNSSDAENFKALWTNLQQTGAIPVAKEMKIILSRNMGNDDFLESAYGAYLEFASNYPEFIPN